MTILRDGRNVLSEVAADALNVEQMVIAMLGEAPLAARAAIAEEVTEATVDTGTRSVRLERVTVPNRLEAVSVVVLQRGRVRGELTEHTLLHAVNAGAAANGGTSGQ